MDGFIPPRKARTVTVPNTIPRASGGPASESALEGDTSQPRLFELAGLRDGETPGWSFELNGARQPRHEDRRRTTCGQPSIMKRSQEPTACLRRPRLWAECAKPLVFETTIMKRTVSVPFWPAVTLIVICAVVFVVCLESQPQEYHGVVRYPIIAVGFETTGVALITPEGTYELALPRTARHPDLLHKLSGRRIVVTGRMTTRKGKWRPERHVIVVEDFRVEPEGESQEKRQPPQSVVVP